MSERAGQSGQPGHTGKPRRPAVTPSMTVTPEALAEAVIRGDRAAIGRAISLVESVRPEDEASAKRLLELLLPRSGAAMRVGITGVPGAGKSTFIERFGMHLIGQGLRVAVLAVDPSSGVTGGSILGDKTRMPRLAAAEGAFIRPSPARMALGGVARRTREAMIVLEAAGYGVVLVETVGVGQSETSVSEMTDFFLGIFIAGAGDELQGIKRGVLELVDAVAINKCDGENKVRAEGAARQLAAAMHMAGRDDGAGPAAVVTCSALSGEGIERVWEIVRDGVAQRRASGRLEIRRREQNLRWLSTLVHDRLEAMIEQSAAAREAMAAAKQAVMDGRTTPSAASELVVSAWLGEVRTAGLGHLGG
jgi:LAO/AO transport system kinase